MMQISLIEKALNIASEFQKLGEVPIGAVLVDAKGSVLAASGNRVMQDHDPTAHAEIVVLREAAQKIGAVRLEGCELYVTLEPCPMCAQAISFARIKTLYFGAWDPKGGGVDHGPQIFNQGTCHHKPTFFGGILANESCDLLQQFFYKCREGS